MEWIKIKNEQKVALILTIGLATEPSIRRINTLKPDLVYFIHSKKSKENALFIIEETGISNYLFKELEDHESVDDTFVKSLECISELKEQDYEVIGDFTVGTKPMVAGLVMACVEEKCEYKYLGESDENSRENGMGPVKDGQSQNKDQDNPYETYAINEFKRAREFFDKYQFLAARENFIQAESKLKYSDLKERSRLFVKIVDFYESWDKFNDEIRIKNEFDNFESIKLNDFLKTEILDEIESNENLLKYFKEEIPVFYKQLKRNKLFLDKKIGSEEDISINILYYLPDLLTNADRRIKEGKYDDAVARLYRIIELIAQLRLSQMKLIDIDILNDKKSFQVLKDSVEKRANSEEIAELTERNIAKFRNHNNLLKVDLSSSYNLLDILSRNRSDDFSDTTKILYKNFKTVRNAFLIRNTSILAHGLKPINEANAKQLYNLTLKHALIYSENVEKNMQFSKFPLFSDDEVKDYE